MTYLYPLMTLLPLIGHDALRARFEDQIVRGTLPSSILLQGPPGVGKQRLALWLGQRLLCSGTGPVRPCGECQHCRYTLDGAHPDLRWYFPMPRLKSPDAALDAISQECQEAVGERVAAHGLYSHPDGSSGIYLYIARLIVQQAVSTPAMAHRKVFVVGDAERMVPQAANPDAANAFLKLLEEPPARRSFSRRANPARFSRRSARASSPFASRRSPTPKSGTGSPSRRRPMPPAQGRWNHSCASPAAHRAR
jgi:DNA polymerase III delta prime subunit